jgi:NADH-quinone oxidoreductase subunit C
MARRIARENPWCEVRERFGNQLELACASDQLVTTLALLKAAGFAHLSNIMCVDRIADGKFELMYNLWSYAHRLHATVKVPLPRLESRAPTALSLWPQAQVYEREIHEFFGVVFTGNPDLGPFFLHNWRDLPPLRKDFDSREYSRLAYGFLEEEQA